MATGLHADTRGADKVDAKWRRGHLGDEIVNGSNTALHFAAQGSHSACVRYLCDSGASLDLVNTDGATALLTACARRNPLSALLLCEIGAKFDIGGVPERDDLEEDEMHSFMRVAME